MTSNSTKRRFFWRFPDANITTAAGAMASGNVVENNQNYEEDEIEDENIWADEEEENHDYPEHYFQNDHHKTHSQNNNMDYLLEVLSLVVKEYMWNAWYKKDDSKEKEEKIHEAKKQKWTIDLR